MNKIKLKYKELNEVSTSLKELKTCLDDVHQNITTIGTMFENNNSGEAVNELITLNNTVLTNVLIQKDNIDTSVIVLDDYIYDTSAIIMPNNADSTVSINYSNLKKNINTLNSCIEEIEDSKKKLGANPKYYNDNVFKIEVTEKDKEDFEINRGRLESVEDEIPTLRKKVLDKLNILEEVKQKVKVLIEFDLDSSQILKSLNDGKYDTENSYKLTNNDIDLEIETMVMGLKQPDGMSNEEFVKYKEEYRDNITALKAEGWDREAIDAYTEYIEINSKSTKDLKKSFGETREIGSGLFTLMYEASSKEEIDKVHFVIDLMGGEYDEFGNLILKDPTSSGRPALKFDSEMHPDSKFFELFANSVSMSYVDSNTEFFDVDGNYNKVHQFRYYIDKHNIEYVRTNFKDSGESDYKAVIDYNDWLLENGIAGVYSGDLDNARFHKRGDQINNSKWMNENGYAEFILDENGNFVTMWDTIKVSKSGDLSLQIGKYNVPYAEVSGKEYSDIKEYLLDNADYADLSEAEIKVAFLEVANTGSFNYSGHYIKKTPSYDVHNVLDVARGKFDPPLRDVITDKYDAPNKEEHDAGRNDELGDILNEYDYKEK